MSRPRPTILLEAVNQQAYKTEQVFRSGQALSNCASH